MHVGDFLHAASIDACAVARDCVHSGDSGAPHRGAIAAWLHWGMHGAGRLGTKRPARRIARRHRSAMAAETRAEIAGVGYEGIVGVSIFMGGNSTPSRAVVQSAAAGCD
jgi:hypothetical protein